MWALFYSMLERILGNRIRRVKSLKWMMNKSTDCSVIHFTPSISYSVQWHKGRWLGIASFDNTCITGFCYSDEKWGHYLPKSKIPFCIFAGLLVLNWCVSQSAEDQNCAVMQAFHFLGFVNLYQMHDEFATKPTEKAVNCLENKHSLKSLKSS